MVVGSITILSLMIHSSSQLLQQIQMNLFATMVVTKWKILGFSSEADSSTGRSLKFEYSIAVDDSLSWREFSSILPTISLKVCMEHK